MARWRLPKSAPSPSAGCRIELLVEPARLGGANGILWSPEGRLLVTQVFGSQVTAIDVDSGEHRDFSGLGAGITVPDDGAFTHDGTFFATEPMRGAVSYRRPDGTSAVLRDDLPSANGITSSLDGRRLFVDEFRPGGRLLELDPTGERSPSVLADGLDMPNALSVGPDGALWFPQVLSGEIWRYDLESGALERRYTDLETPTAVKFDASGALLTSEASGGRITRIDTVTGRRTVVAEPPTGIDNFALSPDGRLFVSHFTDGRVAEWIDGRERLLSAPGLIGPFGLAQAPDGSIVSADGLAVNRIAVDGTVTVELSLLADLPGIAIDVAYLGDDLLVLLQRGQVLRRRPDGSFESFVGHLDRPSAIAADTDGHLLVVERGAGRLLRVDPEGIATVIADELDDPRDVVGTGDGVYWVSRRGGVSSLYDNRIAGSFDGLEDPQGIAAIDGMIIVAEVGRRSLIGIERRSGLRRTLVEDLAIGLPEPDAESPHQFTPLLEWFEGRSPVGGRRRRATAVLVGCDGDGSLRVAVPTV